MKCFKNVAVMLLFSIVSVHVFSQVKPLDAMLSNYQYPYEVYFKDLKSQNQTLKMAYMDVKPKEANGKSVILLHGKNFTGAYWEQTANELAKRGYRVIIPDQIGFGKSSKPEFYEYSLQQLAYNTKSLLDSLNIKQANIIGHSMGGMIAMRFTLMYPEYV